MGSDFVDRAKLEALAEEHAPDVDHSNNRLAVLRASKRESFLAGAAAYAALLEAETTEEWGVALPKSPGVASWPTGSRSGAVANAVAAGIEPNILHRRVLYGPWLPSEGGEKP